jgi:hypothetical protein
MDLLSGSDADLIGILGGGLESSDGIILHILQVDLTSEKDKENGLKQTDCCSFSPAFAFTNEESRNTN